MTVDPNGSAGATAFPRRFLVLAICCLSLLIVGIDTTIVNVALPKIGRDLGASVSGLQWVVDAYTLTLASLLLLSGSTADRWGRRRVFQIGLSLFSAGSLLCSVAHSLGALIAFRAVQAVGGSMLNPVAMSIITSVFTDRRERARAIGIWGGVVGISLGLGPVLGGVLVDAIGWRAIFWLNVPIGVAAIGLTAFFVPESRATRARRTDPLGPLLIIAMLAGTTYTIIESPQHGLASPHTALALAVAVIASGTLVPYEWRRREPLIDPRFFASAPFAGATLIAVAAFGSFGAFLFVTTLYLQDARELSAATAGVFLLPMAGLVLVVSPLSGRWVGRIGPRRSLLTAAVLLLLAGLGLHWATSSATTPAWTLLGCYLLFGAGIGFVNPHHHHRGLRDAAGPGRGGRRGRLHQPPDRRDPGGGGGRLTGQSGQRPGRPGGPAPWVTRRLVVGERSGRSDRAPGHGHHRRMGARHGRADRRTVDTRGLTQPSRCPPRAETATDSHRNSWCAKLSQSTAADTVVSASTEGPAPDTTAATPADRNRCTSAADCGIADTRYG